METPTETCAKDAVGTSETTKPRSNVRIEINLRMKASSPKGFLALPVDCPKKANYLKNELPKKWLREKGQRTDTLRNAGLLCRSPPSLSMNTDLQLMFRTARAMCRSR